MDRPTLPKIDHETGRWFYRNRFYESFWEANYFYQLDFNFFMEEKEYERKQSKKTHVDNASN